MDMGRAVLIGLLAVLALPVTAPARAETPPDAPASGGAARGSRAAAREEAESPSADERTHKTDFLYLEGETGPAYVGLDTFNVKRGLVPWTVRRDDVGAFVGAAAGLKLIFLSVGPHFRVGHFRDWDLWTLDLDLGWHAPLGNVEPFLRLGGGYARLGRAFDSSGVTVKVEGYNLRLAMGADYFVARNLSVGASISGEILGLHRPGVDLNSQDGVLNDLYKFDGASAGLGVTGAAVLGLHL
jgi:hypothetical protein